MKNRVLTFLIIASVLAVCTVSSTAIANPDLVPPYWRSEVGTTFQLWNFSDNTNPGDSEAQLSGNQYGTPTATAEYNKPFVPWIPLDHGHQGVWYIEQGDWLTLHIPDSQDPDPIRQFYLQMIFYTAVDDTEIFMLDPQTAEIDVVQITAIDDYYTYGAFLITLTGDGAALEDIRLSPQGCTLYIDSIAVDTIPEPMTMGLFALGSINIFARRKHYSVAPPNHRCDNQR